MFLFILQFILHFSNNLAIVIEATIPEWDHHENNVDLAFLILSLPPQLWFLLAGISPILFKMVSTGASAVIMLLFLDFETL